MQYIYLHRREESSGKIEYVYHFDDHALSPNNLVLRHLFFCMLDTVGKEIDTIEVEYHDVEMVKRMGMERAVSWLKRMGADTVEQKEYRREGILLSRTFSVPLTAGRMAYLQTIKELDEVYRLLLRGEGEDKIHLFFSKTLSVWIDQEKEEIFLNRLKSRNVPHKTI